jgi:hypothetical protein
LTTQANTNKTQQSTEAGVEDEAEHDQAKLVQMNALKPAIKTLSYEELREGVA